MRLIEQQMVDAIKHGKDWKKDNTEVITINDCSWVYLHHNHIASINNDSVEIYDGGWQTVTTKSRLNALIRGLADGYNQCVYQHKFEWFIRDDWNDTQDVIEFENGYTFKRCR
jgi:hypothetical protein